jgi:hypothetical protein
MLTDPDTLLARGDGGAHVAPNLTKRVGKPRFQTSRWRLAMSSQSEVIETTVSKVAAELVSRGLDPDDRVTITIEPDELIPGRRASRARVIAAGLTDDDIDRLIKQAQKEVEPRVG